MSRFVWREGIPKPKVDAEVFGSIVEKLAEANGGIVKPEDVVAEAERFGSPIAGLFEFDDEVAASKFRIDQARRYVGALQIVRVEIQHGPALNTRAFHRVKQGNRGGYASESMVLGDKDLRKQVIASAARELQSFIRRFEGIAAMGNFVPALQDISDQMRDAVDRIEVDAAARRPHVVRPEAEAVRTAA